MPSRRKPTEKSERRFPRLSASQRALVLREVKKWQDLGLLQYQSQLPTEERAAEERAALKLAVNSRSLASRMVH